MAAAKSKKEKRAEKLGTKRACPECGSKFYDLNNDPIVCPICASTFDPAVLDQQGLVPASEMKSSKPDPEDDEDENLDPAEIDEDDIDEEEVEAKELELDGDDAQIIGGGGDDEENPDLDNIDDDEDEDAALVDDDDADELPPGADDDDDDDEDIELDT
ncbi:MAG: TIGR02300 family protein [Pseudomonadota bacterium]